MSTTKAPPGLTRELGVFGATMMGLGSILGTGVFVSIGVAAGVAGPAVILAILLVALIAACNASSSAQLAASFPVSGGTYDYGYRYLSPALGFTAGWMFLCAKIASAATAALGCAGYLLELLGLTPSARPWVAATLVGVFTLLVQAGLRRTSQLNVVIVTVTLGALLSFVAAGLLHLARHGSPHFTSWPVVADAPAARDFFYATALMFVAYAGYARIATLGEDVRNPAVTIPRAIALSLIVSAAIYVLVAVAAIGAVGSAALAEAAASGATPLEHAARALEWPGLMPAIAIGAVTAMAGVLLNLLVGLSRVVLAMGRQGDLPRQFARLGAAGGSPHVAVGSVGLAVGTLALSGDVELTWAFSAFTVLVYYAITNLAALSLPTAQRRYPRVVAVAGLVACLGLAFAVPPPIWGAGLALIVAGLGWHAAARRLRAD